MTRIVYVNGRYLPYAQAGVHVEDRGFQFADAVYEVCEVKDGRLIDEDAAPGSAWTLARASLRIAHADERRALGSRACARCIKRNRVRDGVVYLQVSRGAAPRDFAVPRR